jgi:hypothetical protein
MVCRECGASHVPFRSIRLAVWRLARMIRQHARTRPRDAEARRHGPSLTELVTLVEGTSRRPVFVPRKLGG